MNNQRELSDKIDKLFFLSNGDFDPAVHLPLAEAIVQELGRERVPWVQLKDVFRLTPPGTNLERVEKERVGNYFVEHSGRLVASAYTGFYPSLDITHWKDEVFNNSFGEDRADPELVISYSGKKVKRVGKLIQVCYMVSLGWLNLGVGGCKPEWIYKT